MESLLRDLGFASVQETARFETFRGTSVETTATHFGVYGANLRAEKL
ncbi:MAG: hypothetical protein P1V35_05175 [Planctomycetota bacterium]|nr:hypothetical protein [Planctomycetota bacterium]